MFCQYPWVGGMLRFMIFMHSVTIESSWNHFQSRTWHLVVRGSYSDARKGRGSWGTRRLKKFRGAVGDNTSFIHWHTGQWVYSWQAPKQMLAHTGGHRYRDRYTGCTDRNTGLQTDIYRQKATVEVKASGLLPQGHISAESHKSGGRSWGDGSAFKSTSCSPREPGFGS